VSPPRATKPDGVIGHPGCASLTSVCDGPRAGDQLPHLPRLTCVTFCDQFCALSARLPAAIWPSSRDSPILRAVPTLPELIGSLLSFTEAEGAEHLPALGKIYPRAQRSLPDGDEADFRDRVRNALVMEAGAVPLSDADRAPDHLIRRLDARPSMEEVRELARKALSERQSERLHDAGVSSEAVDRLKRAGPDLGDIAEMAERVLSSAEVQELMARQSELPGHNGLVAPLSPSAVGESLLATLEQLRKSGELLLATASGFYVSPGSDSNFAKEDPSA
jgi:hypothetical protein